MKNGSECPACGAREYPPVARCLACGVESVPCPLPMSGRIFSSTTVWAGLPDDVPYTVAYVDLDGGPRVFCRLEPHGSYGSSEEVVMVGVAPLTFSRS
ncbi:MAG: OB-fold domain-containing protein [Actinomycetota bacterium]|jgi:uncharacterized OB-fold protein